MEPEQFGHPSAESRPATACAFEVTVTSEGTDVVLEMDGEVDLGTVPTLHTCLEGTAADSCGAVILDLTKVTFLDSSGINAMVRANRALQRSGRRLVLRNPGPFVQRVLHLSAVDTAIDIQGSDGTPLSRPQPEVEPMQLEAAAEERIAELEADIMGLQAAMESRAVIEQAKGVIMHSMRCGPDEAFEILTQRSQAEDRKLREMAAEIVGRDLQ